MTFDDINNLLHSYADAGILEPMVEPIDESDCDPIDYAVVTGLFDEMWPSYDCDIDF